MALSSALTTAKNSMRATASQINIVSQNMAGARDLDYTRRSSEIHAGQYGYTYAQIRRENAPHLLNNYITKSSSFASAHTLAKGGERIAAIHDANDYASSPARLLGHFRDALQTYFNQYDQPGAGSAAIDAAKNLVESLHYGHQELEKLRTDADRDIKASVDHINETLAQFHKVDEQISLAKTSGADLYSLLDQRDALLKKLSGEMAITSVTHDDGTMALYGVDGSTLYDRTPRRVEFSPSVSLSAGVVGSMVTIDGVPVDHSSFNPQGGSGSLGGLLQLRDEIAPKYQKQLDEISHALTDMFPGPPPLFLDGGDASATGLSGRLNVNPDFDVQEGGSPSLLGDRNKILDLVDAFDKKRAFDLAAGIEGEPNLVQFAERSIAWLENIHHQTAGQVEYQQTMFVRAAEALSNETGVNSDEEMALMLQLEQSYAASARIISVVGRMMDDLLAAV